MKIYTKRGDKGLTSLVDGSEISKSNLRIHAYGTLDELNCHVGLLINHLNQEKLFNQEIKNLENLQVLLFQLGSQLACDNDEMAKKLPTISDKETQNLESFIDKMSDELPPLKNFILPGGHIAATQSHICRTICRRCERLCVSLDEQQSLNYPAIPFINRLSDYFFALSRLINLRTNTPDKEWSP